MEETLRQSEPLSLSEDEQRCWRAFLNGSARLREALNRDLEQRGGLTLNEYEILVHLSEAPGWRVRMSSLAELLVHSRSRLTHTIGRMQKRGWVDRVAASEDGRGVDAVLRPAGYDMLVSVAPRHVAFVRQHLLDVLTAEQFQALVEICTIVAGHLHPEENLGTGGRFATST